MATASCLKSVVGGRQVHVPCEILLLQPSPLSYVTLISERSREAAHPYFLGNITRLKQLCLS